MPFYDRLTYCRVCSVGGKVCFFAVEEIVQIVGVFRTIVGRCLVGEVVLGAVVEAVEGVEPAPCRQVLSLAKAQMPSANTYRKLFLYH